MKAREAIGNAGRVKVVEAAVEERQVLPESRGAAVSGREMGLWWNDGKSIKGATGGRGEALRA